jgi:hypothetical protein
MRQLDRLKLHIYLFPFMKRIFLFLAISMFALVSLAQLNPQAANYEKVFWQNIEKLKTLDPETAASSYQSATGLAETNLAKLKKSAPDYDVSKHDAAIKPYLDRMAASGNSQLAANDKRALDATIASFTRDPMNLANYVPRPSSSSPR